MTAVITPTYAQITNYKLICAYVGVIAAVTNLTLRAFRFQVQYVGSFLRDEIGVSFSFSQVLPPSSRRILII
jgi:hypothetical protein